MKKVLFISIFVFLAGNVFSQALDKDQQKAVKQVNNRVSKELNAILKDPVAPRFELLVILT